MSIERPVVVVTGAGAGAARCIAERFGREGWRVGLISRSQERLDDARAEIERLGGGAVEAISGQMIAPRALDQMMATRGWDGQIAPEPNTHARDNRFEPAPGRVGARGRFGARSKLRALIADPDRARIGVGAATAATAMGVAGAALAVGALMGQRRH